MTPQRDPEIPAPVVRSHDDARPPHRDESGPSSRSSDYIAGFKDGQRDKREAVERAEVRAWGDRSELEREVERLRSRLAAAREAWGKRIHCERKCAVGCWQCDLTAALAAAGDKH